MVLHHFGESTLDDIKDVEKECVKAGAKTVVVAGDIAKPETAKDVSDSPVWSRGLQGMMWYILYLCLSW
jgi:hypothetical protein